MADLTLAQKIDALTVEEAKEYAALFALFKGKFPAMSDADLAWCVSVVTGVCPHCFENARGCQCWNDE